MSNKKHTSYAKWIWKSQCHIICVASKGVKSMSQSSLSMEWMSHRSPMNNNNIYNFNGRWNLKHLGYGETCDTEFHSFSSTDCHGLANPKELAPKWRKVQKKQTFIKWTLNVLNKLHIFYWNWTQLLFRCLSRTFHVWIQSQICRSRAHEAYKTIRVGKQNETYTETEQY